MRAFAIGWLCGSLLFGSFFLAVGLLLASDVSPEGNLGFIASIVFWLLIVVIAKAAHVI